MMDAQQSTDTVEQDRRDPAAKDVLSNPPAGGTPVRPNLYIVHAWTRANVHAGPNTWSPVVSFVNKPEHGYWDYRAVCWKLGEEVVVGDIHNPVWIKLELNGGGHGYVNAVYLTGDYFAGLPNGGEDCAACDRSECFD